MYLTNDGHALIGYLSRWGGISSSGVRYLEQHGVLRGERSEGGYRLYSDDDFLRLDLYQRYRTLGFSQGDAIELGFAGPAETMEALRRRRDEELRRHAEVMSVIDEVESATRASQEELWSWRIERRPTFLGLASPLDIRFGEGEQADDAPDELVREDLLWHDRYKTFIGGVYHMDRGVCTRERMTLCEFEEGLPFDVEDMGSSLVIDGRLCLRVLVEGGVQDGEIDFVSRICDIARQADVEVAFEGAVGRILHMRRTDDGLVAIGEVWFPIVEGGE